MGRPKEILHDQSNYIQTKENHAHIFQSKNLDQVYSVIKKNIRRLILFRRIHGEWLNILILIIPLLILFLLWIYVLLTGGEKIQNDIENFGVQIWFTRPESKLESDVLNHIYWQIFGFVFLCLCTIAFLMGVRIWTRFLLTKYNILLSLKFAVIFSIIFTVITLIIHRNGFVLISICESLFRINTTEIYNIGYTTNKVLFWVIWLAGQADYYVFISLSLAAFAIMLHPVKTGASTTDNAARLAQRLGSLRIILFLGSAVLVAGVAASQSLIAWRAGLIQDSVLQNEVLHLGKAVTVIGIARWTINLAVLYLWPLAILHARIEEVYSTVLKQDQTKTRKLWLEENGLSAGPGEWFIKGLALLAPLLASMGIIPLN